MARSMNSRFFINILIISLLLLLQACKTQRSLSRQPVVEKETAFLLQKLQENQVQFEWLTSRASIRMENQNQRIDFRARFRMKKDSIIWASLSPALGLEIARLKISRDSLRYVNRMDRVYYEGDYQLITRIMPTSIDFDLLQSLLLGNSYSLFDRAAFTASVDGDAYRLSSNGSSKPGGHNELDEHPELFIQDVWIDPDHFKMIRMKLKGPGNTNQELLVNYQDFVKIGDERFPSRILFEVKGGAKNHLQIEFSRIELNQAQTFPWRVPDNFTKIE